MASLKLSINGRDVGEISSECCFEFVLLALRYSMPLDEFVSWLIGRDYENSQWSQVSLQAARAAYVEVERFRKAGDDSE